MTWKVRSPSYKANPEVVASNAVPKTLANNPQGVYKPRIVSIGPHHRSEDQVKAMEKHKLEFLNLLLKRNNTLSVKALVESISAPADLEKARKCYSQEINLDDDVHDDKFLEMMVLDGCFLIELFRKANKPKLFEPNDPLAGTAWAVPYMYGDLLLVGNQIPFFVLEQLFQTIKKADHQDSDASLSLLALRFLNEVIQRPDGVIEKFHERAKSNDQKPLHLLDLVRSSLLIGPNTSNKSAEGNTRLIHCISKLRRSGIKVELRKKADSFLDVKFRKGIFGNGVIQMPNITMDYHMKAFLVNCVAFEQLHNRRTEQLHDTKQFTVYARFFDGLVNTAKDVDYLCDRNIIDHYFGRDGEIVEFINKMGKNLSFDDDQFYLSHLFKHVDECYTNKINQQVTSFKLRYFNTPWSGISALAALVLLVFTFLQTYYTIYAYVNPN